MQERVSSAATAAILALVLLMIGGGIFLLVNSRPGPVAITIHPPIPTATPQPTATPGPIQVYVTGAVASPGQIHSLPAGSRVQEAIDAAGGPTDEADLERVNLAGLLRDGDQVHVPSSDPAADIALATPSGGDVVNINTATVEELQRLPGIGPVTAQNIVDYREQHGPFSSVDDLDSVPGIGRATINRLLELAVAE